ncbi:TolC family protein [Niabella drilacis]|uniref:Outer membrane protein TolC n=1 Tax=Niabella drilacis (strain DSM 25811 / CCM 8410 / CCUG 62505 / LMG 26954 / E90) TaxID=1285928 RepID=A0A1G6VSW3_NIADE|nr:TolC family protein [Niabella drilacis]SDD56523.1 Outer membrane protein TolC [Niabella drilacis]
MYRKFLLVQVVVIFSVTAAAQSQLSLKEAIRMATANYPVLKAKAAYAKASEQRVAAAQKEQLPNINLGVQQDYGTINGTNGPLYGFGGLAAASSGPALAGQNWNAAFGALYLTNVNWEFFAFGKYREKVKAATQVWQRDLKDLAQELFEQKIKVAAAYLTLVASHQITRSYEKNRGRADSIRRFVIARVKNGLVAGVDSSLANAEYSSAQILLTNALDKEQEQKNILAQLIGSEDAAFTVDTVFVAQVPGSYLDTAVRGGAHPVLEYYKSRIAVSDQQAHYLKTQYYPAFSLVGVWQSRASGFENDYVADQTHYSSDFWKGINPNRSNYLVGVGVTWNIIQPVRLSRQVSAQRMISQALQEEYNAAALQLRTQLRTADNKMSNALSNYKEAPVQVKAAGDAYLQKSVLYKNGLTNMVDVIQAGYTLTRAETDRDIAGNNLWQALLLKAAAMGDFELFEEQLQ